jgi:hypothetical protein
MTLRYVDKDALAKMVAERTFGHAHFWERALTRRKMLGTAAGGAAMLFAATALRPLLAFAATQGSEPRPIPGGLSVGDVGWHVDGPAPSATSGAPTAEMSSIYDFDGIVAAADTQGTGTGRQSGVALPLAFDTDMRFMRGRYRGMDGRMYRGTFGFI